MGNSSKKVQVLQCTAKLMAISAISAFTLTMALYQVASIIPLVSEVFAQEPPEQSCSPPGQEQSGNSLNPNCVGGAPLPNCVSEASESGCRNVGTCTDFQSQNRPFFRTPACPGEED